MTSPNIRTERSFEAFSRGAELIREIHRLSERTSEQVEALKSEFDLTADEWTLWSDIARGAVVKIAQPAEKTYTFTLTENEMARVIHALREDRTRSLAVADEMGAEAGVVPQLHAEACETLADHLCGLVKPEHDPARPTDERWREEAQHHL